MSSKVMLAYTRTFNYCPVNLNEKLTIFRISSGEKPFKCDICPAAFVASSSLAAHRRQHKKDNILPSCKLCGMQFSDRLLLTMHMYDHKHKRWVNAPE